MNRYLTTAYAPGGRGPDAFDCWGLVRDARHELLGRPLLPSHGAISPADKRGLTRACGEVVDQHLHECLPRAGAIAAGWSGRVCVHVGLLIDVDGRLLVLETDEPTGPCLTRPYQFESRYTRVTYYDDQNIPEHARRPAD